MRVIALVAAAFTAATLSTQAQETGYDAQTVLATVNGKDIKLGHVIVLLERLPEQYQSLGDDQLYKGILEQLVDQTILADTESPEGVVDLRTQMTLENERVSILSNKVVGRLAAQPLDEAQLQAIYDRKFASFEPTPESNASHILVETADEAQAIVEELRAGADFAETAKAKSTGPSGPRGGELGWFGPGQMVAPFQEAVEALEIGEISEPVQTQFGWHVIKLNDRRDTAPPSFEEMREDLESELRDQIVRDGLESLRVGAEVTYHDPVIPFSAIRESGLLDQ